MKGAATGLADYGVGIQASVRRRGMPRKEANDVSIVPILPG